ncbi:hypothetical protein [Microbulbifer rhizosphaerae]|uniref:Uncharacterized protein n=1 Tax=Microbulbifer rhizosphaerae TaxID=1562603 RepID=A0A7W4WBT9_9GAMM|nr:hypothetical protein [Microbulbifer rhizosphaerae]MBB3061396.1 hypothetical protein [Microbulbifer rhizosphaerae]
MIPMDFSTTIPLRTGSETSDTWRLAISLTIALGVHAALITIPVSLVPLLPGTAASNKYPLKIILLSSKNTEASQAPNTDHPTTPAKPRKPERRSAEKSNKAEAGRPPAPSRPDAEIQSKSTPKPETPSTAGTRSMDIPADSGAKSRSTVFDPKLEKKLARERNKVRKFKSRDTEYTTTTGTFVQQGDRCWEVKKSDPSDMSSESSLWFRMKCPKASRSESDIDRLAEKYGIP